MRRAQLGRRSRIEDTAGDPLEGLVNLFDIGIVLAVAFLIAGLSLTLDQRANEPSREVSTTHGLSTIQGLSATRGLSATQMLQPSGTESTESTEPTGNAGNAGNAGNTGPAGNGPQTLAAPARMQPGGGQGRPLGTLYRLSDGRLLLVPERSH